MKIEAGEFDESVVTLDTYNSDLNLVIDATRYSASPLTSEGFAFMWAGARATHGAAKGKFCFEVKVTEHLDVSHLPKDEPNPHVVRVGFSVESSTLQLGEDPLSYGYGGTGKISTNCQFKDFGSPFMQGDVVLAVVNMDSDPVQIGFAKNGNFIGWAYRIGKSELKGQELFPHVLTKNCSFEVNFGQKEKPYFPLPNAAKDFIFIACVPPEQRIGGTRPPLKREDCEMIMMCGLPGAGKSVWAAEYSAKHPEKKYNVLGTNNIIDKMKVMGLPRKRNYAGRWDVLIQMSTKCLNKMFEIGSKLKRNYILDQTNVYPTAQRRKMRNFEGFKRIAVVVVPTEEEYKRRCDKRDREEGKDIPDQAVLEMKANFKLPEANDIFDDVIFTELPRQEAEDLVLKYNEEGRAATGPPQKRFRSNDQSPGFGGNRGYDAGRGNFVSNRNSPSGPGRGGFAGRGGFEKDRGGFEGGRGRGSFAGGRGGYEGNRSFDGGRGGYDSGRGGFDGGTGGYDSNRGFDGSRGGYDGGRGGRGGYDGGRGSRGGYDSGRGGYDGGRGGGYDGARGGGYDGGRGGSGGYERGRGGGYDGGRSGGYDGGRGAGYDGGRSGGYDSGRGGGYDGGFGGGRGDYEENRDSFDRKKGFDEGPRRFERTQGGPGSGGRSFDGNSGGYAGGSQGSYGDFNADTGSFGSDSGNYAARGRGNSRNDYGGGRGSGSQTNYGGRDFSYGSEGGQSGSNFGKDPSHSTYDKGSPNARNNRGGFRGGASRDGPRGGSSRGGNTATRGNTGSSRGYGGNGQSGSRGAYSGGDYGVSSSYSSGYGSYQNDYTDKSGGTFQSSSDYSRRDTSSYPPAPPGGFKKEPGQATESGGFDGGSRPRGGGRPGGRTNTRWSAETSQPYTQRAPAAAQDSSSYSNFGAAVKSEPPSSTGGSRYDSSSTPGTNYASYGQGSQTSQGFQGTQAFGYPQGTSASAPQAWSAPQVGTGAVAQGADQAQWSQYYQQPPQTNQYFSQYYGQQAAGAAPTYGSVYGGAK